MPPCTVEASISKSAPLGSRSSIEPFTDSISIRWRPPSWSNEASTLPLTLSRETSPERPEAIDLAVHRRSGHPAGKAVDAQRAVDQVDVAQLGAVGNLDGVVDVAAVVVPRPAALALGIVGVDRHPVLGRLDLDLDPVEAFLAARGDGRLDAHRGAVPGLDLDVAVDVVDREDAAALERVDLAEGFFEAEGGGRQEEGRQRGRQQAGNS